jgi:Ca2+-binding EF-hand superfamily protein
MSRGRRGTAVTRVIQKRDIDEENDNVKYITKGERGRKALFTSEGSSRKKHHHGGSNNAQTGIRGRIDLNDIEAFSHLTSYEINEMKGEVGWWWLLNGKRWRVKYRANLLADDAQMTVFEPRWRRDNSRNAIMKKGIDWLFGERVKLRWAYYPYKETFEFLQFTKMDAIRMYMVFADADIARSGLLSEFEWLMYLNIERDAFNEKIFSIINMNGTGEIDYREFCMACWNFASASAKDLVNFAFLLYSSDGALLQAHEILSMLKASFGNDIESNKNAVNMQTALLTMCEKTNGIDLSQFGEYGKTHMALLKPAFNFQRTLQKKILGTKFWAEQSKRRLQKFGDTFWTDLYEQLRNVAADEIEKAEAYLQGKRILELDKKSEVKNKRLEEKPAVFVPKPVTKKKKVKHVKHSKPRFLTDKNKEKERHEILDEFYLDVDLTLAFERNTMVKEAQVEEEKKERDPNEEHSVEALDVLVDNIPGASHMNYSKLTELRHLQRVSKLQKGEAVERQRVEIEEQQTATILRSESSAFGQRGLFEFADVLAANEASRQEEL